MWCPSIPAGYVLLAESLRKLVCSIESTFRLDSWLHYKSCVLFLACTCLYNYCYFCIGKMKIPSFLWSFLGSKSVQYITWQYMWQSGFVFWPVKIKKDQPSGQKWFKPGFNGQNGQNWSKLKFTSKTGEKL